MKTQRLTSLVLIAAVVLAVMPLAIVPAFAADMGPVPAHVIVAGTDLYGKTQAEALHVIKYRVAVPNMVPLQVQALKAQPVLKSANTYLLVDQAKMLAGVYASDPTTTTTMTPSYMGNTAKLTAWVTAVAKNVNYVAKNSKRTVAKAELVISAPRSGRSLRIGIDVSRMAGRLIADASNEPTTTHNTSILALPYAETQAKITQKNIGLTILVSESLCKIKFYTGATKKYDWPCAPGMPKYPSPKGTFKVVQKVSMPSWHNPYDAWSKGMPAVIGPGPNNPLGTRALYLNYPGIRIHGIPVSENHSLGHRASHGCIRVLRKNIETLYPQVPIGTMVIIVK